LAAGVISVTRIVGAADLSGGMSEMACHNSYFQISRTSRAVTGFR